MEMKQHELEWKEIGRAEGYAEGYAEGKAEGFAEGLMEVKRENAAKMYEALFELTGSSEKAFQAVRDGYPEFTPEEIEKIISETDIDQ